MTNSNRFLDWIRLSPQGSKQGWIGSQTIEHGSNRVGTWKQNVPKTLWAGLGPKVPNWVAAGCSSGWTICVDSSWVGLIWPHYFEGFFSVWVCGLISIKISFETTLDGVFWWLLRLYDISQYCISNTSGPYFWTNLEYYWSLSGPYFSWIFKKILARIGKTEKQFRFQASMDKQV